MFLFQSTSSYRSAHTAALLSDLGFYLLPNHKRFIVILSWIFNNNNKGLQLIFVRSIVRGWRRVCASVRSVVAWSSPVDGVNYARSIFVTRARSYEGHSIQLTKHWCDWFCSCVSIPGNGEKLSALCLILSKKKKERKKLYLHLSLSLSPTQSESK